MIKILNQKRTSLYDLNRANFFRDKNFIFVSEKYHLQPGEFDIIAEYNDEEECKLNFEMFLINLLPLMRGNNDSLYIYQFPEKKERNKDEGK